VAIPLASSGGSDISYINLPLAPDAVVEISNFGTAKTNYLILDFQNVSTNNPLITINLPAAASYSAGSIIQVYVKSIHINGGNSDVNTYLIGAETDYLCDPVNHWGEIISLANLYSYDVLSNANSFKVVSDGVSNWLRVK
jgi:hypothetical protein